MELNNNQILLLAVAAVALYFFMKYRECSKQENFSSLNINDKKRWHDRWRDNMIACGLNLGKKNCYKKNGIKKAPPRFINGKWNPKYDDYLECKSNQTNECMKSNERDCSRYSGNYHYYKASFKKNRKRGYEKRMKYYCDKLKSNKCHPNHTDKDCK